MLKHIPSNERGQTSSDRAESQHSFSFGDYLNHKRMGYSVLQVLNEHQVKPDLNAQTETSENIEILTYVTQGVLLHADNMGNQKRDPAGDFQLLSCGNGVSHSIGNASKEETLSYLQMHLLPNQINIHPGYQQRTIAPSSNFQLVASHSPRDNAMFLNQDAEVYRFHLDMNRYFYLARAVDHHQAYIHVVSGELNLCDGTDTLSVGQGDGVMCSDIDRLEFIKTHTEIAEGLLFVLPGDY